MRFHFILFTVFLLSCALTIGTVEDISASQRKKVLVVMSYHPGYPSGIEIKTGIEKVLRDVDLTYFYLNTKNNYDSGSQKAKEAFELYQKLQPDALLVTDDNAQSMFVLPYLKDKVSTPIVFCGVNDDATKYGYPTSHITGVLEKKHFREGINLAQLIEPNLKKIAVIMKDNPSNQTNTAQIQKEMATYPVEITDFIHLTTLAETLETISELEKTNDGIIIFNLTGITDQEGNPMEGQNAIGHIVRKTRLITIGASKWEIVGGMLCGVVKSMEEQGSLAATMVDKIFSGTAVSDLPITSNKNGQRYINVTTADLLGLKLKPMVLLGTELIK